MVVICSLCQKWVEMKPYVRTTQRVMHCRIPFACDLR